MKVTFAFLCGLALGSIVAIFTVISSKTLAFSDRNVDGQISIGEFLFPDVGFNEIFRGGFSCTEVYLLKDGLPVAEHCPVR